MSWRLIVFTEKSKNCLIDDVSFESNLFGVKVTIVLMKT